MTTSRNTFSSFGKNEQIHFCPGNNKPFFSAVCPVRRAVKICGNVQWSTTHSLDSALRADKRESNRTSSGWARGFATAAGQSSRPACPPSRGGRFSSRGSRPRGMPGGSHTPSGRHSPRLIKFIKMVCLCIRRQRTLLSKFQQR